VKLQANITTPVKPDGIEGAIERELRYEIGMREHSMRPNPRLRLSGKQVIVEVVTETDDDGDWSATLEILIDDDAWSQYEAGNGYNGLRDMEIAIEDLFVTDDIGPDNVIVRIEHHEGVLV